MVVRASSICNDEDLWSLLQRSYQEFLQLHYLRTLDAKEVSPQVMIDITNYFE